MKNVSWNIFSLSILSFIVIFLYYFILETKYGKTIGKMILGMKVVDANGEFSGNWHDGLSETYVVNLKAVEEDMRKSKE